MAWQLLRADALGLVAADDPVVPAAEVSRLRDADALLAAARALHESIAAEVEAARARGHAEGVAAGLAEGRNTAADEAHTELFALARRAAAERDRQRGEVAKLALQVVRRIAGEVGPPAIVAGLAETAAASLLPDTVATVRVPPAATAATIGRLGKWPSLTVVADETLADDDCIVETSFGSTRAGLETQLAAVDRAWKGENVR